MSNFMICIIINIKELISYSVFNIIISFIFPININNSSFTSRHFCRRCTYYYSELLAEVCLVSIACH